GTNLRSFFKFFTKDDNKSKNIAKERLKMVLTHDRSTVPPKYLDMMRDDMLQVMSSYMELDEEGLDIQLTRVVNDDDTYTSTLVANIPVKKMKNIGKNNG